MKRKITLLLAAAASIIQLNAQVVLNESFTTPFVPASAGWVVQNNSVPTGTTTWHQGFASTFSANTGATSDYFAVDYNSQASTAGGISNFLITPTLNLTNGAVIQFATRTATGNFPDRLQLLMSQGSGTGAIGTGTTAVGTFTTLLEDINPSLTTTGYPIVWTVYSSTLSGITGTVVGRFAFRYFVDDGGFSGSNSDYIGIDDVQYSLPCAQPTLVVTPTSITICASNQPLTLSASGANTYTWSTSATTSSITIPSVTSSAIYTVTGSSTPGCNSSQTISVNYSPANVSVNNVTVCASTAATLVATGATTYSWSNSATTSSIVVTPTANTVYTVTGVNGTCADTKTVSVTLGSLLSVLASSSSSAVCGGSSATLTASGAATYTWLPSGSGSSIVVTPTANTTYSVAGSSGTCFGGNTVAIVFNANPTLTVTSSASVACTSSSVSITGAGANSYTWSLGTSTAAANPITLTTGTAAVNATLNLVGSNAAGCTSTISFVQVISVCTGIDNNSIANAAAAVFPNPFTNELTLNGINGSVEIVNTLGQVVLRTTVAESQTINTSNFANGVYFIKVKNIDSKQEKTIKVIKN